MLTYNRRDLLIEALPVLRGALLLGLSSLALVCSGDWCWSCPSRLDGLRRRVSSLDWLRSRPSSLDGLRSGSSSLNGLRSLLSYLCGR